MSGLFGRALAEHPAFSLFWEAYPRKEAKGRARPAFIKALKKVAPETLLAALRAYKFSPDREFIPLPATWLNDERWEDQPGSRNVVASQHTLAPEKFDPTIWPLVDKLKPYLPDETLISWFSGARLDGPEIVVSSQFRATWIAQNYSDNIRKVNGSFSIRVK